MICATYSKDHLSIVFLPLGQFPTALHSPGFNKNSVFVGSQEILPWINTHTDIHHFFVYINNVQWQSLHKEASKISPIMQDILLKIISTN